MKGKARLAKGLLSSTEKMDMTFGDTVGGLAADGENALEGSEKYFEGAEAAAEESAEKTLTKSADQVSLAADAVAEGAEKDEERMVANEAQIGAVVDTVLPGAEAGEQAAAGALADGVSAVEKQNSAAASSAY